MAVYILRRVLTMVPLIIGLSIIVFGLVQLAPGDPATYFAGEDAPEAMRERIREELGLDQPIPVQYWNWVTDAARGDLGTTFSYGRPVSSMIVQRLGPTLQLQVAAILFSLIFAIPIGIISAVKRYSKLDHFVTSGSLFGLSMPDFWFGLLMILLFSVHLGFLPAFGMGEGNLVERAPHFVMPVLTLGLSTIPWYARFMRSSMIEVLGLDYIRTARAKGVSERWVLMRHALKVAILPVITIIGLTLPRLVGGSIIVESIFAWPGLGRLAYDAVVRSDYPLIMGIVLFAGAFVLVLNLIVDLIYTRLDPRISYESSR